jgi:hypothetical protein
MKISARKANLWLLVEKGEFFMRPILAWETAVSPVQQQILIEDDDSLVKSAIPIMVGAGRRGFNLAEANSLVSAPSRPA